MKSFIKLFIMALTVIAIMFWAALAHTKPAKRVYCIAAEYARISPCEWIGISSCGSTWKVVVPLTVANADSMFKARGAGHSVGHASGDKAEAWYWNQEDGSWNQMERVPALGDTIGWIQAPE